MDPEKLKNTAFHSWQGSQVRLSAVPVSLDHSEKIWSITSESISLTEQGEFLFPYLPQGMYRLLWKDSSGHRAELEVELISENENIEEIIFMIEL